MLRLWSLLVPLALLRHSLLSIHQVSLSPTKYWMMLLITKPAPQFPAESWSMNHNVQTMPMHPHMLPSQSPNNIAYNTYDRQNMYAVHNYYGSPTNH